MYEPLLELRVTAIGSWTDCVIALRSRMDHVIALRQISVTAQCYSSILFKREQENPSSRCEGTSTVQIRLHMTEAGHVGLTLRMRDEERAPYPGTGHPLGTGTTRNLAY